MRDADITLFNYHEASDKWYLTVLHHVSVRVLDGTKPNTQGIVSGDSFSASIYCSADKVADSTPKGKRFIPPDIFSASDEPEACFTFNTEKDFVFNGIWDTLEAVEDSQFEEGLYNELNSSNRGIYRITSCSFWGLIPHFEIGGQ